MKKGRLIPQSRLHAFVVARLGCGPDIGESLLEMAADALVRLGVVSPDNLQVLCADCKHGKGMADWRGEQPRAP